jgi:hypothetical protein
MGNPDPAKIRTSHCGEAESHDPHADGRLTRLTNASSKKWDNLWAAHCIHFAYYNFCRIHKALRVTPKMEAGLTNRVWEIRRPSR